MLLELFYSVIFQVIQPEDPKSCQKYLQEGVMSALDSAYTETGD